VPHSRARRRIVDRARADDDDQPVSAPLRISWIAKRAVWTISLRDFTDWDFSQDLGGRGELLDFRDAKIVGAPGHRAARCESWWYAATFPPGRGANQ